MPFFLNIDGWHFLQAGRVSINSVLQEPYVKSIWLTEASMLIFFLNYTYVFWHVTHWYFFLPAHGTVSFNKDISCPCYFSICVALLHLKIKAKTYEYVSQVIQMMVLVWCDMTQICVMIRACSKLFILGKTYLQREFSWIYRESMELSCNWRE